VRAPNEGSSVRSLHTLPTDRAAPLLDQAAAAQAATPANDAEPGEGDAEGNTEGNTEGDDEANSEANSEAQRRAGGRRADRAHAGAEGSTRVRAGPREAAQGGREAGTGKAK
jgi:hypothetical protein